MKKAKGYMKKWLLAVTVMAMLMGCGLAPIPLSVPKVAAEGGCYEVQKQPMDVSSDILVIITYHEADGSTRSVDEPINPDFVDEFIAQMTAGYTPCSINTEPDPGEPDRQYITDDDGNSYRPAPPPGGDNPDTGYVPINPRPNNPADNQPPAPPPPPAPKPKPPIRPGQEEGPIKFTPASGDNETGDDEEDETYYPGRDNTDGNETPGVARSVIIMHILQSSDGNQTLAVYSEQRTYDKDPTVLNLAELELQGPVRQSWTHQFGNNGLIMSPPNYPYYTVTSDVNQIDIYYEAYDTTPPEDNNGKECYKIAYIAHFVYLGEVDTEIYNHIMNGPNGKVLPQKGTLVAEDAGSFSDYIDLSDPNNTSSVNGTIHMGQDAAEGSVNISDIIAAAGLSGSLTVAQGSFDVMNGYHENGKMSQGGTVTLHTVPCGDPPQEIYITLLREKGKTTGGDNPGGSNTPGGNTPGGSTPGGNTPGGNHPGGNIPPVKNPPVHLNPPGSGWHPGDDQNQNINGKLTKDNTPSGALDIPQSEVGDIPVDEDFLNSIAWDAVYDVIIEGINASGAVSAVSAVEADAQSVLMLDIGTAESVGGHSRYASQNVLYAEDKDKALSYFEALQGSYGNLAPEFLKLLAEGAYTAPGWLIEHGLAELFRLEDKADFSSFLGGDVMRLFRFSEADAYDEGMWLFLIDLLDHYKDFIDFSYETELLSLIQDPASGMVLGVEIERGGKTYKIRANHGVILADEGFENNPEMVQNYLQMPEAFPMYNTQNMGFGIRAAQEIGADLWHMGNVAGYDLISKNLKEGADPRVLLQGSKNHRIGVRSGFVVGSNGRRFLNEVRRPRLGHLDPKGTWVSQEIPETAWLVMDEAGLTQAPLYADWSENNQEEVDMHWIHKADTIEDLAVYMNVDAEALKQQLLDYNAICDQGYDWQEGRHPKTLYRLSDNGPYYALPMIPMLRFTLGGPKKNEAGQVLSVSGKIIPHLYTAGTTGSLFSDIFPAGGELMEAILTGRISGTNAAVDKGDAPVTKLPETKFIP